MRHASLFTGIGGFDLAAEWMGWENIFQVEKDPFCLQILQQHFPNATRHTDVREFDGYPYQGLIDILTGGFPCQPYSTAGKRLGKEDERHLWPEMLRIIRDVSPRWVVGENVRGLVNWNGGMVFDEVQADLEAAGYEVTPYLLPAAGVGAPHRRERIWFIAYTSGNGYQYRKFAENRRTQEQGQKQEDKRKWIWDDTIRKSTKGNAAETHYPGLEECQCFTNNNVPQRPSSERNIDWWEHWPTQPGICGRNDGVPHRVDRIKALGNAIVPQVALQIFKAIEQYETSFGCYGRRP